MKRVLLILVLFAGACSDSAVTDTAPSSTASVTTITSATSSQLPSTSDQLVPWPPFDAATITFDGEALPVLLADTPEQRSQGLMNVTDMAGFAGMLFVFEDEVTSGFWMKDTLLPLTVIYFDAQGNEVSRAEMEPCLDGNACPSHPPDGKYLYALEMATGSNLLPSVPAEATITLFE